MTSQNTKSGTQACLQGGKCSASALALELTCSVSALPAQGITEVCASAEKSNIWKQLAERSGAPKNEVT